MGSSFGEKRLAAAGSTAICPNQSVVGVGLDWTTAASLVRVHPLVGLWDLALSRTGMKSCECFRNAVAQRWATPTLTLGIGFLTMWSDSRPTLHGTGHGHAALWHAVMHLGLDQVATVANADGDLSTGNAA